MSSFDLHRIYAKELEANDQVQEALVFHTKCLQKAKEVKDSAAESLANFQLGQLHQQLDNYQLALR